MGLSYSNARRASMLARIRRERKAQAAAEGVDVNDRRAFQEWEVKRARELLDRLTPRKR